jgi:ribonuclease HI
MKKWYVVYKGKVPGIYEEWKHCSEQVTGFPGNSHKSYKSKEETRPTWVNHLLEEERKKNRTKNFFVIPVLLTVIAVLVYLLVV